jgi:alpha-tubulin suppressor-like RCC1 family protein
VRRALALVLALGCGLVFAVATASASSASALTAGYYHTCALTSLGAVKCWGYNVYGSLGDGTNTNRNTPVDVIGLSTGVTAISAGYRHTCAVTGAGAVKCWGWNFLGQLGDGTNTDSNKPVGVIGLGSGVTAVTADGDHACALTTTGAVKCWGHNSFGQLGDGTNTNSNKPVGVIGLGSGVTEISAGAHHTCALTSTGAVMCWGYNVYGELGDGNNTTSYTPVVVSGLGSGVMAVGAGGDHTCVLMSTGAVKCWGRNSYGELGDGNNTSINRPVGVVGLGSGATAITAYTSNTCALTSAGAVKCWGRNTYGELGDGTNTDSNTPVGVSGLGSGATATSAGAVHTCALTTAGAVKCWGYNLYGELGDGTNTNSNTPVGVSGLGSAADPSISAIAAAHPTWPSAGQCTEVASFIDPDTAATASEYSATVNWGDGRIAPNRQIIGVAPGDFRVSACHRYVIAGTYTVAITITDIDNTSNTATVKFVTVAQQATTARQRIRRASPPDATMTGTYQPQLAGRS